MTNLDDPLVCVRRHPSDWQTAAVPLSRLRNPHWGSMSGGVGKRTSRPAIFVRIWCDAIDDDEFPHSCRHGPAPHDILVCVPKVCNSREIYATLKQAADEDRASRKVATA